MARWRAQASPESVLIDALRMSPRNIDLLTELATLYVQMEDWPRAEQVEREGRDDVARGLVGEVLTLDLRRAPGTVRFELKRKHDVLRRGERGDVDSAA